MVSFGGVDLQPLTQGLFDIFRYFLWISIAVILIHDISPAVSTAFPGIVRLLKASTSPFSQFTYFPIDSGIVNATINYDQILQKTRPISRVVLLLVMTDQARAFLVFIYAEPYLSIRRRGELVWRTGDQNDQKEIGRTMLVLDPNKVVQVGRNRPVFQIAKAGFRSLLHFTGTCGVPGNNPEQYVLDTVKSEGIAKYNADYMEKEETNEISMSAYYSVKALGEVLHESVERQLNIRDGRALAARFGNRTFRFNSRPVIMNSARVRMMDYCLRDLSPVTVNKEPVMSYDALSRKLRPILNKTIDWGTLGNIQPKDVPECGHLGDAPECQELGGWDLTAVLSWALPVGFLLCIGLGGLFWWIHFRIHLHDTWWLLPANGLSLMSSASKIYSQYISFMMLQKAVTGLA